LKYRHKHKFTQFLQTAETAGFSLKVSGFLAAIKLTDKSGYADNGYPDMQTLVAQCFRATL